MRTPGPAAKASPPAPSPPARAPSDPVTRAAEPPEPLLGSGRCRGDGGRAGGRGSGRMERRGRCLCEICTCGCHRCPRNPKKIYENSVQPCPTTEYLENYPQHGPVVPPPSLKPKQEIQANHGKMEGITTFKEVVMLRLTAPPWSWTHRNCRSPEPIRCGPAPCCLLRTAPDHFCPPNSIGNAPRQSGRLEGAYQDPRLTGQAKTGGCHGLPHSVGSRAHVCPLVLPGSVRQQQGPIGEPDRVVVQGPSPLQPRHLGLRLPWGGNEKVSGGCWRGQPRYCMHPSIAQARGWFLVSGVLEDGTRSVRIGRAGIKSGSA
uniref:Stabilizer of axonemal microtubules 2 n=1 Tax=Ornithorhynchus anatinus TaxID=9258 RepID=A0A6I8NKU4_ORNAN